MGESFVVIIDKGDQSDKNGRGEDGSRYDFDHGTSPFQTTKSSHLGCEFFGNPKR